MLKKLLKEQIWAILIYLGAMAFSGWILMAYHLGVQALIFFEGCFLVCGIACLLIYLLPRYRFYREAVRAQQELEEKYMLYDILEAPGFLEGQVLCALMEEAGRAMKQRIAAYERASQEYREYIEAWVHEVKTPIASGKLLAENNPSEQMDAMASELSKIDSYIEQALYYARSSSAEKDYLVRRYPLEELVRGALRSQARPLILGGVAVHMETLDYTVYTDAKWMNFMLGQVLGNSAKYGAKNLRIWRRAGNIPCCTWQTTASALAGRILAGFLRRGLPAKTAGFMENPRAWGFTYAKSSRISWGWAFRPIRAKKAACASALSSQRAALQKCKESVSQANGKPFYFGLH